MTTVTSEHPNAYTAEEMASNLWQTAPPELHAQIDARLHGFESTAAQPGPTGTVVGVAPYDFTSTREQEGNGVSVGYVRRDIFEVFAARVTELESRIRDVVGDMDNFIEQEYEPALDTVERWASVLEDPQ